MGLIAEKYADSVMLTSDNPRNENPLGIIEDIRRDQRQIPNYDKYRQRVGDQYFSQKCEKMMLS